MASSLTSSILLPGQTTLRGSEYFPDPFMDMASAHLPRSHGDVLRWVEFLWMKQGLYREAMRRVLAYFITDIEILDDQASREEKEKCLDFLVETMGLKTALYAAGEDYLCYGNSFAHLHPSFRRSLSCRACHGLERPLKEVYYDPNLDFEWSNFEFVATCPRCKTRGPWDHQDRRGPTDPIKLIRRSPHEMEILYDEFTHNTAYVWKIPEEYRRQFFQKKPPLIVLEEARWEVLKAIQKNQYFQFDPDTIFHMRDEMLAGIRNRGWGISRVLSNFGQAWYVQVLHRYNEAIALDYVVPFRVITPAARAGGADSASVDPVLGGNLGAFNARVQAMLRRRRRDPAAWNVLPFPVQYQAMGGEATALAPKDLLDQGIENLLAAAGVPVDLYRGTLTTQAAPTSLRLFESNWLPLVHNINNLINFVVRKVSRLMDWEPVTARLTRTTMADDVQRQANLLQLMSMKQVSQTTGLKAVGREFQEEQMRMLEEEQFVADKTREMQERQSGKEEMTQAVQAAGQGAGGAPAGPGGAAPGGAAPGAGGGAPPGMNEKVSLQEVIYQAQQIAQRLKSMPESQKDSEMIALRKANPALASVVKDQMAQITQQTNTQGGAQLREQMFGKQGSALGSQPRGIYRRRVRSVE